MLDEGTYLCSTSTTHRLLHDHGEVRGEPGPVPMVFHPIQAAEHGLDQRTGEGEHQHRIRGMTVSPGLTDSEVVRDPTFVWRY
ncbi:hypothetical protein [Nocardia heshunensis]